MYHIWDVKIDHSLGLIEEQRFISITEWVTQVKDKIKQNTQNLFKKKGEFHIK